MTIRRQGYRYLNLVTGVFVTCLITANIILSWFPLSTPRGGAQARMSIAMAIPGRSSPVPGWP
jgi:hypothetical protein